MSRFRNLDTVENLGDVLKSTLTNADDAETLAHDALTSIDARANEIKKNMKSAKKLQDNHEEMKVCFGLAFSGEGRIPQSSIIYILYILMRVAISLLYSIKT